MRKLLAMAGYALLTLGAISAATTSVTQYEPVEAEPETGLTHVRTVQLQDLELRDAPLGMEYIRTMQALEQPVEDIPLPMALRIVPFMAREEEFYGHHISQTRPRYNRKKHRAQRNGWHV